MGEVKSRYFYSFITSALDGGERSVYWTTWLPWNNPLYLLNRRLDGSQSLSESFEREIRVSYPNWESKHDSSDVKPIALSRTTPFLLCLSKIIRIEANHWPSVGNIPHVWMRIVLTRVFCNWPNGSSALYTTVHWTLCLPEYDFEYITSLSSVCHSSCLALYACSVNYGTVKLMHSNDECLRLAKKETAQWQWTLWSGR